MSLQEKYNQFALQSNKASDEIAYWRREKNIVDVQLSIANGMLAEKEGRLQEMASLLKDLKNNFSALQIQNDESATKLARASTKIRRRDESPKVLKHFVRPTDPQQATSALMKHFAAKNIPGNEIVDGIVKTLISRKTFHNHIKKH